MMRERSEAEKDIKTGGFLDVRRWRSSDIKQKALAEISKVSQQCLYKKRLPYCDKCAINEVDSQIEIVESKIKKARTRRDSNLEIEFDIDYKKFGGFNRFEELDPTEIEEDKLLDGMRSRVVTGQYRNFICKTCESNLAMEFKQRELEAKKKAKVVDVEEEDAVSTKQ